MDLTNPQIVMRDKEIAQLRAENARLREELAAEIKMRNVWQCAYEESREELAAAQAVIEQMREALLDAKCRIYRLGGDNGIQVDVLSIQCNQDALHEARALECERLKNRYRENSPCSWWLDEEAAAHRARKENSHE